MNTATTSDTATTTTTAAGADPAPALSPSALLSDLGSREDRARGFGKASSLPADSIPLLGGAPSEDLLPLAQIRHAAEDLTADPSALAAALQYSQSPGLAGLRDWIGRREGAEPARIVVTNGAFHGLSLLFDALLDEGDAVIVEDPTYPLIFRDLQHKRPRLVPLRLTESGFDIDALEARLVAGERPKLLYTVPDHHNPTGYVTTPAERARLVELAERFGFVIVSDNAYHSLGFDGPSLPDYPLGSDRVVHVRTFSKVLGPGLRLGWLALPTWLVGPVTRLRANQDQHSSVLVQAIVERVLGAGSAAHPAPGDGPLAPRGFDAIAARARTAYAERFDLVTSILEEQVPGGIEVVHRTGGIFAWVRVRDERIDLAAAQRVARERTGTDAVLGRYFFWEGADGGSGANPADDRGALRVGISHLPPERLREGAERLAAALSDTEARG
ncbi:PLP-dependent aminotransferase family protein [Brachybacterium halotolerans subsp. kimchii]|uniref:aminotransferase-like domain-containing protein n=1 Tax=Brachybacterium halotolerans TaxID=2795215 RepID=UPI001E576AD8|nr:PLP-dependent aminotransferase family protein [Brachybacterium halotolerans]UEJ82123.1 PLP-dependent aminotransferase family protein [Brachybacterium halotolerans subsp. kimchii]